MPTESSDPESLLAQSLEQMNRAWLRASAGWHDAAREDFDREYIEDFRQAAKRSQHAIRNVTALLRQIRKECGETQ